MNLWFGILTLVFIVLSAAMILVILVQRPTGGGLAGAFGGAAGGGTDTVFGGRVGDALTVITIVGFIAWLILAVSLNLVESSTAVVQEPPATITAPAGESPPQEGETGGVQPPATAPPSTTPVPLTDGIMNINEEPPADDSDQQPATPAGGRE